MNKDLLRQLPSIDELLNTSELKELASAHSNALLTDISRDVVSEIRNDILHSESYDAKLLSAETIAHIIAERINRIFAPSMRNAINAAGIILHTGLGRALMPSAAVEAVHDVIKGYSTLAVHPETGQRMSRDVHVNDLLCRLTGAEASTIANNNAAATMLILNTLASGKEVIISRGQLVEIGGSFRMPDVMAGSGAIMREVGTTNKTHLKDYASAINDNTGAIMRVHHSNYRIIGFHDEPSILQLADLAHKHNLPVIDDLGSGALVDLSRYGLESEPAVQDSIKAKADAVCFSGDKLIGGPQCGIILGAKNVIDQIKQNPLSRAMRAGKMTVAGLEATLRLFLNPENLEQNHPLYRMMSLSVEQLMERAQSILSRLRQNVGDFADIQLTHDGTQIGSGSVPGETLPTIVIALKPLKTSADLFAKKLRYGNPPMFTRIRQDALLLDLRTIQPDEDDKVVEILSRLLTSV